MWIRIALLPFRYPIVMAMLYRGGTLSSMWMWSGIALPSTSSISFWRHRSRRIWPMPRRILPYNTLRRYFGRITTWYLQSHFTWAWLCQSFMGGPPCPSGPSSRRTVSDSRRERQSLQESHRQRRWIPIDLSRQQLARGDRGDGTPSTGGYHMTVQDLSPMEAAMEPEQIRDALRRRYADV